MIKPQFLCEPDYDYFKYKTNEGFSALIILGNIGTLSGYVKIPEYHPYYKKNYPDVDIYFDRKLKPSNFEHAEFLKTPEDWYLGFYYSSEWDHFWPNEKSKNSYLSKKYRDIQYMKDGIASLSQQLFLAIKS